MSGTVDTKAVEYAIRNDSMTGVPPASLSIPNIHPAEDRRSRIRPRVRGDSKWNSWTQPKKQGYEMLRLPLRFLPV